MTPLANQTKRVGVSAGILLLCLIWKFVSYPLFLGAVALCSFVVLLVVIRGFPFKRPFDEAVKRLLALWCILATATLAPISLSFGHLPGPPRFVTYVKGKPNRHTIEAAKRGECILGGCLLWPLEPR